MIEGNQGHKLLHRIYHQFSYHKSCWNVLIPFCVNASTAYNNNSSKKMGNEVFESSHLNKMYEIVFAKHDNK